jgi:hypothetical protein
MDIAEQGCEGSSGLIWLRAGYNGGGCSYEHGDKPLAFIKLVDFKPPN